ncbi:alkaline phosphatase family protein [bacterium]|nr:alkaline phosphatase family protein [bacterium]
MRGLALALGVLGVVGCQVGPDPAPPFTADVQAGAPPASAMEALRAYYRTIPDSALPVAPAGKPLPDQASRLTRILIASCLDEELEAPALAAMSRETADLVLMLGDNVYGDIDQAAGVIDDDPDLVELRQSFADLSVRADFAALRAAHPMLATWDDHDFGKNDSGADFLFREFAERIHERFWGLDATEAGSRPGVYFSRAFGPEGARLQIIMLDTRFFRSPLTRTDEYNKKGKERWIPSADSTRQEMLGEAQWAWLESELEKPADLRLLVSSIQVTPDVHGWEAWAKMPKERARLYDLLRSTGASDETVIVSGDRHTSFLYSNTAAAVGRAIPEITASSLNKSFSRTEVSDEKDAQQVGDNYAFTNYGAIGVDWEKRSVALEIRSEAGAVVRSMTVGF